MSTPPSNYEPGGISWSTDNVATVPEIVAHFDHLSLDHREIFQHNWSTCSRDCSASWDVTDETYINGVMMTLDFDFIMGYLIEAVDRTSSQCTYVAIVHYHGPAADGTHEHDFRSWEGTHTFFGKEEGFSHEDVCKWAVGVIYGMIEARRDARRP